MYGTTAAPRGDGVLDRASSEYQLFPNARNWYPDNTLTWSVNTNVVPGDPREPFFDLTHTFSETYQRVIRDAFQAWERASDINFVEVEDSSQSNIRVGFLSRIGRSDGEGGLLAEGGTVNGRPTGGYVGFDPEDQGSWTDELIYDLALHEIGHALGIDHSDVPDVVMSGLPDTPYWNPPGRNVLQPDDIDAVNELYPLGGATPPGDSNPDPTRQVGTPDPDTLVGTTGRDALEGLGGNDALLGVGEVPDTLIGGAGDTLLGGAGDDRMWGGRGDDTLIGGSGNDLMFGQEDDDYLDGGDQHDTILGGGGDDRLTGGDGDDRLWGQSGRDVIEGGSGHDVLGGGSGSDTLYGRGGNDYVWGESGDDFLDGGTSKDILVGGLGDDTLHGSREGDTFFGQEGSDQFVLRAGTTAKPNESWIMDYEHGLDEIVAPGLTDLPGQATQQGEHLRIDFDNGAVYLAWTTLTDLWLTGGERNDTLHGTYGHDSLLGWEGDDSLSGGSGRDTLDGGSGHDTLVGGLGDDSLLGGGGRDSLTGGDGDDFLDGGTNRDILVGGLGDDTLHGSRVGDTFYGGEGADRFVLQAGTNWIMDYEHGTDEIRGAGLTDLAAQATQVGVDLRVDFDGGTVFLAATTLADVGWTPEPIDPIDPVDLVWF